MPYINGKYYTEREISDIKRRTSSRMDFNDVSFQNRTLQDKIDSIKKNIKDMPIEFQEVIDDNFWGLVR